MGTSQKKTEVTEVIYMDIEIALIKYKYQVKLNGYIHLSVVDVRVVTCRLPLTLVQSYN